MAERSLDPERSLPHPDERRGNLTDRLFMGRDLLYGPGGPYVDSSRSCQPTTTTFLSGVRSRATILRCRMGLG